MISAPCKMFVRQISRRISLKMSIFSLHVQKSLLSANANDFENRHEGLGPRSIFSRPRVVKSIQSIRGTATDGNNSFSIYQINEIKT